MKDKHEKYEEIMLRHIIFMLLKTYRSEDC